MKKNLIFKLCFTAVMSGLFVVLDLVSIKLGNQLKITVSGLPIILVALLFGPIYGCVSGLLGAFIGQLLSYGLSATTVLWILPAGIRGLLVGLVFLAFSKSDKYIYILINIIISSLAVTAANTLVLYIDSNIYGYYNPLAFLSDVGVRVVSSIITALALSIVTLPVYKAIKKQFKN